MKPYTPRGGPMPAWWTTLILGALIATMVLIFVMSTGGCAATTRTVPGGALPAVEQVQHDVTAAQEKLKRAEPLIAADTPKVLVREAGRDLERAKQAATEARAAAEGLEKALDKAEDEIARLKADDRTTKALNGLGIVLMVGGLLAVAVGIWLKSPFVWQAGALSMGVGIGLIWLARNLVPILYGVTGLVLLVVAFLLWKYRRLWLDTFAVIRSIDDARDKGYVTFNTGSTEALDKVQGPGGKALVDAVQRVGKRQKRGAASESK